MSYEIDYNDQQFQQVEADKNAAMAQTNQAYDSMINDTQAEFQKQIEATESWGQTQQQLQQERTDFTLEQIQQQKDQAHKDLQKEQQAAYTDWQRQSGNYGVNAEQMAAAGMKNTGFSESSQVSMYNTYQNRVATARESYDKAVLNYNNSMKEAQLQNNSVLAEIANNTLQASLALSMEGVVQNNALLTDKMNAQRQDEDRYYQRRQDIIAQRNTENAMAEQVRQYNEGLKWDKDKYAKDDEYRRERDAKADEIDLRNFNYQQERDTKADEKDQRNFEYQQGRDAKADEIDQRNFDYQVERDTKADEKDQRNFEYQQGRDAVADSQWNKSHQLDVDIFNESKRQYNQNYALSERSQDETERKNKADEDYQNKYLELQREKEGLKGSGSSSGSSSGSGGSKSGSSDGNTPKKITDDNKTDTATSSNDGVMVDGVGPLTASALRRKLNSGEVISYKDKKGNVKYKKNPDYKNGKTVQKTTKNSSKK